MKTSIIVLPYKILAHTCDKTNCSHDQIKVDLTVDGTRVSIHPFFTTGEEHHSAFPKLIQKDIPFFSSNKDEEVPTVMLQKTYSSTKEVNAFHIDYLDGDIIDAVELSIVDGILRHFKVLSNQYWINSPIKQLQRKYKTYPVTYPSGRIEIGSSSEIVRVEDYPFTLTVLHQSIWQEAVNNFQSGIQIMDKEYFLDGITYFHYGQLKKMIIDFSLSIEIPKNRLFKNKWLISNPTEDEDKYDDRSMGLYNNTITDHISKNLKEHFGKSFKDDFPLEYKYISYLWKFRGKIAHGDPAIIDHDISGLSLNKIDHKELIRSVKVLRDYLTTIEEGMTT